MDQTASEISFDSEGICNFCRTWERIEAKRIGEKGNLPTIVRKIKEDGKGKPYDILLGLSGGVDSSMCLHYLVQLGLRPMTYTVDNGWNTKEADENIMRLVEGLKVPFFRYVIDVEKFRELQRAFLLSNTPNIEIPTDHILMATTFEMADKYDIRYVISGGNHATEGIMPESWGYQPRDLRFIKSVYKRFTGKNLKGLPLCSLVKFNWYKWVKGIETINLLDYFEYNRDDAIKLLQATYGYKPYGDKHGESVFTKWFQRRYLPLKFGFVKEKAHYASMINSKQVTRDEALEKLMTQEILDNLEEFPIDLTTKRTHRDYPNSEFWWNFWSAIVRTCRSLKAQRTS